ncbi:hypothetical protein BH24ACT23_BH24ACT23_01760 [soil metagenome]|jgi:uncharacterized protein YndB with AHSA1/START domain
MPKVSRARTIQAAPARVWDLVSDPHNLPRWWPKVIRVEDVTGKGNRARWTAVLETERGRGVRADYRCVDAASERNYAWAQDIADTPFERILRESVMAVEIKPDGDGARVRLTSVESLRGLSRLGSGMLRGAARRRLDEALDGMDLALVGGDGA